MDIGKPEEFLQTNKIILDADAKNLKLKRARNFELKTPVAIEKERNDRGKIGYRTLRYLRKKHNGGKKRRK